MIIKCPCCGENIEINEDWEIVSQSSFIILKPSDFGYEFGMKGGENENNGTDES